ncbi:uncharacterized protein BJ171DRAFT_528814 [Polychytrium aggregatum]|uniref:uncharacterized protein n=1 Tax=Polychytrium aggregatum TaxID=110093 RepID=UPI0022FF1E50|nr:uncharacterized protein BJ171DRAFT_528814 [Polychytrium aggregatum]KAI9193303.1 hypothetical protein BJ171DRAFT_528814 [Polychytrium aggregatum]
MDRKHDFFLPSSRVLHHRSSNGYGLSLDEASGLKGMNLLAFEDSLASPLRKRDTTDYPEYSRAAVSSLPNPDTNLHAYLPSFLAGPLTQSNSIISAQDEDDPLQLLPTRTPRSLFLSPQATTAHPSLRARPSAEEPAFQLFPEPSSYPHTIVPRESFPYYRTNLPHGMVRLEHAPTRPHLSDGPILRYSMEFMMSFSVCSKRPADMAFIPGITGTVKTVRIKEPKTLATHRHSAPHSLHQTRSVDGMTASLNLMGGGPASLHSGLLSFSRSPLSPLGAPFFLNPASPTTSVALSSMYADADHMHASVPLRRSLVIQKPATTIPESLMADDSDLQFDLDIDDDPAGYLEGSVPRLSLSRMTSLERTSNISRSAPIAISSPSQSALGLSAPRVELNRRSLQLPTESWNSAASSFGLRPAIHNSLPAADPSSLSSDDDLPSEGFDACGYERSSGGTILAHLAKDEAEDGCPVRWMRKSVYWPQREGYLVVPHRKWKNGGFETVDSRHFMVMSYNVLAPMYCNETKLHQTDPKWLQWEHRRQKLLEEMAFYSPDFICLQELPPRDFKDFFLPELQALGYEGHFQHKKREHSAEGCAIFYNESRFQLLAVQAFAYNDQIPLDASPALKSRLAPFPNIAIICVFQNRHARALRLRVVNTHLHWDPKFTDTKLLQAALLMEWLERVNPEIPTVIAGDLNSRFGEPVVDFLVRGKVVPSAVFGEQDFGRFSVGTPAGGPLIAGGIATVTGVGASSGPPSHPGGLSSSLPNNISAAAAGSSNGQGYHATGQNPHPPQLLRHGTKLASAYDRKDLPYTNKTPDFEGVIDHILYTSGTLSIRDVLTELEGTPPPPPKDPSLKHQRSQLQSTQADRLERNPDGTEVRDRDESQSVGGDVSVSEASAQPIEQQQQQQQQQQSEAGKPSDIIFAPVDSAATDAAKGFADAADSAATAVPAEEPPKDTAPVADTRPPPPIQPSYLRSLPSLPAEHFPSDHLCLCAWLKWKTVPVGVSPSGGSRMGSSLNGGGSRRGHHANSLKRSSMGLNSGYALSGSSIMNGSPENSSLQVRSMASMSAISQPLSPSNHHQYYLHQQQQQQQHQHQHHQQQQHQTPQSQLAPQLQGQQQQHQQHPQHPQHPQQSLHANLYQSSSLTNYGPSDPRLAVSMPTYHPHGSSINFGAMSMGVNVANSMGHQSLYASPHQHSGSQGAMALSPGPVGRDSQQQLLMAEMFPPLSASASPGRSANLAGSLSHKSKSSLSLGPKKPTMGK